MLALLQQVAQQLHQVENTTMNITSVVTVVVGIITVVIFFFTFRSLVEKQITRLEVQIKHLEGKFAELEEHRLLERITRLETKIDNLTDLIQSYLNDIRETARLAVETSRLLGELRAEHELIKNQCGDK